MDGDRRVERDPSQARVSLPAIVLAYMQAREAQWLEPRDVAEGIAHPSVEAIRHVLNGLTVAGNLVKRTPRRNQGLRATYRLIAEKAPGLEHFWPHPIKR